MKVLLIGIGGTYNYGCEAIVRGTVEKLRSLFPEIQVDYASSRVEDDKKRLEGCNVNIISRKNKWAWWNLTRNILDRLSIKNSISTEDLSLIKKYDAVFSIGGDIYTIFDDGSYAKHLVQYGDICEKYGVPYILWGCSVGPFEQNPAILEIFKKHLKNISLIVAREKVTVDYLKSIGIEKNVVFSFDPAFSVPSIKKVEKKESFKTVGINLSPLSLLFLKKNKEEAIRIHADVVHTLVSQYNMKVILLPHVIAEYIGDDDFRYLHSIYEALSNEDRQRVSFVDNDPGFIGIKAILKECDFIFAARMHCGINAICCGIPTIFLSYSEKSKGMSRLVYGTDRYCVPLDLFSSMHLDKLLMLCEELSCKDLKDVSKKDLELKEQLCNIIRTNG